MDAEAAVSLSGDLGLWLNGGNPVLHWEREDAGDALEAFVRKLDEAGLLRRMDDRYLEGLLARFRVLDGEAFMKDPYLRYVRPEADLRSGRFLLARVEYQKGELLQYRMPDYSGEYPELSVGCFSSPVRTLALYENGMPWMTVCPSEISSMAGPMRRAHGRVLTLGLGLGYFPLAVSGRAEVSDVTIVEREKDVIALFREHLLPKFPHPDKIQVVEADALDFCAGLSDGAFDYCFADLWFGQEDGAPMYLALRELLSPLRRMETEYWIEKEIRAYLLYRYGNP